MGYTTSFKGELLFTKELKASELAELSKFLGEDCRDHPEWNNTSLTYIDLKLNKDFTGLEWDGSEKTYDLVDKVNLIIDNMKTISPNFGLTGELLAQGEDVGDVWHLTIENGKAKYKKIDLSHKKKVTCPHCEEEFFLEEEKENKSDNDKFVIVFSGFRDEYLAKGLEEIGHQMDENISRKTTHLVMKDISKMSSKRIKANEYSCKICSIDEIEKLLE